MKRLAFVLVPFLAAVLIGAGCSDQPPRPAGEIKPGEVKTSSQKKTINVTPQEEK